MAIEYGSSPDEQPADQIRIFLTDLRSRIPGTISSANAASCQDQETRTPDHWPLATTSLSSPAKSPRSPLRDGCRPCATPPPEDRGRAVCAARRGRKPRREWRCFRGLGTDAGTTRGPAACRAPAPLIAARTCRDRAARCAAPAARFGRREQPP